MGSQSKKLLLPSNWKIGCIRWTRLCMILYLIMGLAGRAGREGPLGIIQFPDVLLTEMGLSKIANKLRRSSSHHVTAEVLATCESESSRLSIAAESFPKILFPSSITSPHCFFLFTSILSLFLPSLAVIPCAVPPIAITVFAHTKLIHWWGRSFGQARNAATSYQYVCSADPNSQQHELRAGYRRLDDDVRTPRWISDFHEHTCWNPQCETKKRRLKISTTFSEVP